MSIYPPKINERFARPKNVGAAPNEPDAATGTGASLICGSFARFCLRIDDATKTIVDARFKSDGCGYAIAAADVLTEKLRGRRTTDLHAADENFWRVEIERELGAFPPARRHCQEICADALRAALAAHRARRVEEFAGEKALICTCFGVSEETVERLVAENQIETVDEVTDICRAAGGCGSCAFLIQEIIDVYWSENF